MSNSKLDVSIKYYPKTTKGHEIGTITFRGELDGLIDSDRVELVVEAEAVYFKKNTDGTGLKLNNKKIQLWSLAWIAKEFEGEYPLKYDIETGMYRILKCDRQEEDKNEGSRFGVPVNYTPHAQEKKVPPAKNMEKVIITTLIDTILNSEDINEIKAVAVTVKTLLKGGK